MRHWFSDATSQRDRCRRRGSGRERERGSVLFEFPMIFGLLLVPFGLLILALPTWVERQTAARDAAGESARYLVLNGTDGATTAEQIVRDIEAGYGFEAGTLVASIPEGGLVPGESVTVQVSVVIPATVLPIFGGIGEVQWTTEHTERVPDYGATR